MTAPAAVAAVAAAMGPGWTATPGPWGNGADAYLRGPDGALLLVGPASHRQSERGRWAVSGGVPGPLLQAAGPASGISHRDRPRITVRADRPAADIAREILRRVVPRHLELLTLARRAAAQWGRMAEERDRDVRTLADAAAPLGVQWLDEHGGRIHVGGPGQPMRGEIGMPVGGMVHLHLEVRADDARALLETLGERIESRA